MNNNPALRTLKPFAHAPPEAAAPAAPFRSIGGVDVQDRYSPGEGTLLHEMQQRDKRSVLKGKLAGVLHIMVIEVPVRKEFLEFDSCTRGICKVHDLPGNLMERSFELLLLAGLHPLEFPELVLAIEFRAVLR